jgi:cation diffusion facilitator CzcD-associated flavoprotein CzcO
MLTDSRCNQLAAEYVRSKIRAIVKDRKTAELLCPDYTILSKRPPLGHFYYEAFNRDNVKLVDVKTNPIQVITPKGLRTGTEEYDFDVIIFAVGFDAITGTLAQIDIRNDHDQVLGEELNNNMSTAYGITTPGFPNLFMISGPQAPFANIPVIIDNTVDWVGKLLTYMREHGHACIDTKPDTAKEWTELVNAAFNATVLPEGAKQTRSWYIGANLEGKTVQPLFWFGGLGPYIAYCDKEVTEGFLGFTFGQGGHGQIDALAQARL